MTQLSVGTVQSIHLASSIGALAFFGDQLVIAAPTALTFYSLEAKP